MKRNYLLAVAASALAFAPAWAADTGPSDAQIAAIVVTANQVDIDAGKLAAAKGHAREVREFGQRMVTDHSSVNQSAVELATRLGVKPEPNETSRSLEQGGKANLERLKKLSGAEFDRAYLANEVTYHQTVLDALDKTLIPSADNAELKALLVKVRPAFVAHLEHARQLRDTIGARRD
ncbi:MAG TPA: DUF4142 domain-containing protein [Steroidobacteraceae bacterium]